ncbi:hypothetical protein C8Q77DRAFT_1140810 [Trametes polyzona]|nr:hypothetical protein C8Q77DRAFT_1140810 [Trametes polyzona]
MAVFFSLPMTYAVAEIDIEKTLQPLDDPIAISEGKRIKTTKYIYIAFAIPLLLISGMHRTRYSRLFSCRFPRHNHSST